MMMMMINIHSFVMFILTHLVIILGVFANAPSAPSTRDVGVLCYSTRALVETPKLVGHSQAHWDLPCTASALSLLMMVSKFIQ